MQRGQGTEPKPATPDNVMHSHTTLLQTLLENAFLNTITPTVGIIGATCERLFGRGTKAVIADITEEGFTLELTAKGETASIHFKTTPATDTENNTRIIGVEL